MSLYILNDDLTAREIERARPSALDWSLCISNLNEDPSLFAYPVDVIHERYDNDVLDVYVSDGTMVVATCGSVSKVTDRVRMAVPTLPDHRIVEISTCWLAPRLRRRGLFSRIQSVKEMKNEGSILFAQTYGLGERHLLEHEHWLPVPWDGAPYVSSLFGWVVGDQFRNRAGDHIARKNMSEDGVLQLNDTDSIGYHTLWCQSADEYETAILFNLEIEKRFPGEAGLKGFRRLLAEERH